MKAKSNRPMPSLGSDAEAKGIPHSRYVRLLLESDAAH